MKKDKEISAAAICRIHPLRIPRTSRKLQKQQRREL